MQRFSITIVATITLLTLATSPALADPPTWTPFGGIYQYQDFGPGAEIKLSGSDTTNPGACTLAGSNIIVPWSGLTETYRKQLTAALLAAYLAKKQVAVKVNNTCSAGGYREYYAVKLQD